MRRWCAPPPLCSVTTPSQWRCYGVTGFSLFVKEVQDREKVLTARSIEEGHANMKKMSSLWRCLSRYQRMAYNIQARRRQVFRSKDAVKRDNNFNLVMKLFSGSEVLLDAGDAQFTAMMAKRTIEALSPRDEARMRKKLKVDKAVLRTSWKERRSKKGSAYMRMMMPSMRLFQSFTEMQRAVAPTRKALYVGIIGTQSTYYPSEVALKSVKQNFNSLQIEERRAFNPISDEEAPFFEQFCARRCAGLDPDHFNILLLFCQFRGLHLNKRSTPRQLEALYRGIYSADRVHGSVYAKAHRSLERLQECRSSDCGYYITSQTPEAARVPPSTYGVDSSVSDVTIATMLVETRKNQSVYDDVLERAGLLRPKGSQKLLEMYNMKAVKASAETMPEVTTLSAHVVTALQQATEKVKVQPPKLKSSQQVASSSSVPPPPCADFVSQPVKGATVAKEKKTRKVGRKSRQKADRLQAKTKPAKNRSAPKTSLTTQAQETIAEVVPSGAIAKESPIDDRATLSVAPESSKRLKTGGKRRAPKPVRHEKHDRQSVVSRPEAVAEVKTTTERGEEDASSVQVKKAAVRPMRSAKRKLVSRRERIAKLKHDLLSTAKSQRIVRSEAAQEQNATPTTGTIESSTREEIADLLRAQLKGFL